MPCLLTTLDVFYGDLTPNQAHVYARLPRSASDSGLTLSGQVRGPRCLHAETLPSLAPLLDMGPGPTLLARAVVQDPCFWSADLPAIYDVVVHLYRDDNLLATARCEIGLRSLGVRGRQFVLAGKRWVLRGVTSRSTPAILPRAWREAAAACVAPLDEQRLAEASQWGALCVVELPGESSAMESALRQLARQPAAAMAVASSELPFDFPSKTVAPNVLLLQRVKAGEQANLRPWARGLWADASDPAAIGQLLTQVDLPVVAVRPSASPLPIEQARQACDALQRDLAPVGQFAGYVV